MTKKEAEELCERIRAHWPILALKSRNAHGKAEWTERAKDWFAAFKKVDFEAMQTAVSKWFKTQTKEPSYAELVREAARQQKDTGRNDWAGQFRNGDILCDPETGMIGILDKTCRQPCLEIEKPGREHWKPHWVVQIMLKDLADPRNLVLSRLELCSVERATKQLGAWQKAYAADPLHWHNEPPWHLFEAAERLLKARS